MNARARSWPTAFNLVMATGIVSIGAQQFGLHAASLVLLCLAALALCSMVVPHARRVPVLVSLLRRTRTLEQGVPGLAFVAAVAVLGNRLLLLGGPAARTVAYILLGAGAAVWLLVLTAVLPRFEPSFGQPHFARARGSWLLAAVATEGLAILIGNLTVHARGVAIALWVLGGVLYLQVWQLLALRVRRRGLPPEQFTPDWWIVMGGLAIFVVAGATVLHGRAGSAAGVVVIGAWALASAWIPLLVGAELRRIKILGRPRFTPERWSMIFPLGMYSVAGTLAGHSFDVHWIARVGHWWFPLALAAWLAAAIGELRSPAYK